MMLGVPSLMLQLSVSAEPRWQSPHFSVVPHTTAVAFVPWHLMFVHVADVYDDGAVNAPAACVAVVPAFVVSKARSMTPFVWLAPAIAVPVAFTKPLWHVAQSL